MDGRAILALYDAQMRADPPAEIGIRSEWAGSVLRRLGERSFIEHWIFDSGAAHAAVAAEAAHFRGAGLGVEWRVFSHDGPPNLKSALAETGFAPAPPETFMVFDLTALPEVGAIPSVSVRRVTDLRGVEDVMAVRTEAFGDASPDLGRELAARLADPALLLFVAYADGRPLASGRLEAPDGRPFAGLYGGGVAPDSRGRGLYRALVAARAAQAKRLGRRYLTVDAADTSRPLLQRMGFVPLATVRGWTLQP